MGRTYISTLADCRRHGPIIEITYHHCGRQAYLHADDLIGLTSRMGWTIREHQYLDLLQTVLRCNGGRGTFGCERKGAKVRAVWPHELKVPAGVPAVAFLNADDRERKRLIRIARG